MAQMKQIKTPEKELSDKEIAKLSDAEFKTLVIRMLTEMVGYSCEIEEKVKAMQSEIKKNVQGTNSEVKETRTQINSLEQKEEVSNKEIANPSDAEFKTLVIRMLTELIELSCKMKEEILPKVK